MRFHHVAALLTVFLLLASHPPAKQEPAKRALIIAISDYPQGDNSYNQLNAEKDAELMTIALQKQKFTHITPLLDAQATQQGIRKALEDLHTASQPGDVVVIHFSGHGAQLTDDSGDELDGLDESVVPYDAPAYAGAAGNAYLAGEVKHIRDDELNTFLAKLRTKLGPEGHVAVFLDSCHSGTGTRNPGGPQPRGQQDPIGLPATVNGFPAEDMGAGFDMPGVTTGAQAPFVAIAGAASSEWNYETVDNDGNAVGSLSLALSRTLVKLNEGDTYNGLFTRLAAEMLRLTNKQTPQIEGDTDREVFGKAVVQQAYYEVAKVKSDTVYTKDGSLSGLLPGTELVFYPIDTQNPNDTSNRRQAKGYVDAAREMQARVIVDSAGTGVDLMNTWVFVEKQGFGRMLVDVHVEVDETTPGFAALDEKLKEMKVVNTIPGRSNQAVKNAVNLVIESKSKDHPSTVILRTAVDHVQVGSPKVLTNEGDFDQLIENILNYARNQYLKQVTLQHPDINVSLELAPATHHFDDFTGECESSDMNNYTSVRKAGYWEMKEGDGYLLKVINNSAIDVNIAIIEILADGSTQQLAPYAPYTANEFIVQAKTGRLIDELCYSITPPYGLEMLKLFATTHPINFNPILGAIRGEGRSEGQGNGPFEVLFEDVQSGTRSDVRPVSKTAGSTDQLMLRVIE